MHKPTIYINPKFRNAHINPNFLSKQNVSAHTQQHALLDQPKASGPAVPTNIHVNPNFIRPTHSLPPQPLYPAVPSLGSVSEAPSNPAPIISQTSRHLVRQALVVPTPSVNSAPAARPAAASYLASSPARIILKTSRHLVRQPLHVRPAAAAATTIPSSKIASNSPLLRIGTRKLVRRANNNPAVTIARPSSKLIVIKSNGLHSPNKYRLARRPILRLTPSSRPNTTTSLKMVNLNIDGVNYKSTANKLQRHEATKNDPMPATVATSKFNTLLRNPETYRIRNRLTAARQKSIQTLLGPAGNKSKNNVPCPIFQRLGKCAALERGRCRRTHDIRNVAICSKFLQGSCQASPCLLSHTVNLSKMPVCKFFLAGICGKTDCPYLHKKLNAKAEICRDFLRGFCNLADQCDKRHEFLCPDFTANGKCGPSAGSRCPYPHRADGDERGAPIKRAKLMSPNRMAAKAPRKRVLLKEREQSTREANGDEAADDSIATTDDTLVLIPSRLQLGALPSFIQL